MPNYFTGQAHHLSHLLFSWQGGSYSSTPSPRTPALSLGKNSFLVGTVIRHVDGEQGVLEPKVVFHISIISHEAFLEKALNRTYLPVCPDRSLRHRANPSLRTGVPSTPPAWGSHPCQSPASGAGCANHTTRLDPAY